MRIPPQSRLNSTHPLKKRPNDNESALLRATSQDERCASPGALTCSAASVKQPPCCTASAATTPRARERSTRSRTGTRGRGAPDSKGEREGSVTLVPFIAERQAAAMPISAAEKAMKRYRKSRGEVTHHGSRQFMRGVTGLALPIKLLSRGAAPTPRRGETASSPTSSSPSVP